MRLSLASRLTREGDLEAVRVQGKRIRTTPFEVRHIASPLHGPRVGVIVPRFGHTAVERNLVKRRLRSLMRVEMLPALRALPKIDVVVRAFPSAYGARYDELKSAMLSAVARLRQRTTEDDGVRPQTTGHDRGGT